jgi:hypothetical protein
MPIDFLTDAERDRLRRFPSTIATVDINAFFTLSATDITEIYKHNGAHNRLGCALQLCTLRYLGFVPDDVADLPASVVNYVAQQLEIALEALKAYGSRPQTRTDHLVAVRDYLQFREGSTADMANITEWLLEQALEHDRPTLLLQLVNDKFYSEKILRPGITLLERLVATARKRAQLVVYRRLESLLNNETKLWIDGLLLADDTTDRTPLAWLRKKPEANTASAILTAIKKLETLKLWGVPTWDLQVLNHNLSKQLYQIGKNSTVHELQRLPVVRRYPVLITLVHQTWEETVDETIELYERCLAEVDARSKREQLAVRNHAAHSTNEKLRLLKDLARMILNPAVTDAQLRVTIHNRVSPPYWNAQPPSVINYYAKWMKNILNFW